MNERIKALAEFAGYNGHYATEEFDVDEFARLIVLKCADLVENSVWHLPRGYKAVDQAEFLMKHFGVEE